MKVRAFDLDLADPKLFGCGSPGVAVTVLSCGGTAAWSAWRALACASCSFISTKCSMRFLIGGSGSSNEGNADEALPVSGSSSGLNRGTCSL